MGTQGRGEGQGLFDFGLPRSFSCRDLLFSCAQPLSGLSCIVSFLFLSARSSRQNALFCTAHSGRERSRGERKGLSVQSVWRHPGPEWDFEMQVILPPSPSPARQCHVGRRMCGVKANWE